MTQEKREKLTQRVHRTYLIREAENFRSHKKGLPEWIKNAHDSYTRHEEINDRDMSNLPILINISKNEIACLDFGGAKSEDMIEHIPYYGSPDAASQGNLRLSEKVSGGHGNGGKYYALSQFKECTVTSYFSSKLTQLTLTQEGDYIDFKDKKMEPEEVIKLLGLDLWHYFMKHKEGQRLLNQIREGSINLFCWRGMHPKDKMQIDNLRDLGHILTAVANHPQARSALKHRNISILFRGELKWSPLKPQEVEPDESFGVREFALPNNIDGVKFNTRQNSTLKVTLANEPLTGDWASLNILEIEAFGNPIAYYEIPQLLMDKGLSKSLYAQIDCPELKADYNCVDNERIHLIEGKTETMVFLDWCKSKLKEVLDELTSVEKKKEQREHLNELGSFLNNITNEIAELLEEENLLKPHYKKEGPLTEVVDDIPTTEVTGFGGEGKIETKGQGIRKGRKKGEANSENKKSKSTLQIKLSNHDPDPLDPECKPFDMVERQPVLYQRFKDIEYGIWWINSQKGYIKKVRIKDPGAIPFYFFLVKEIVLSHRLRRRFRERERYEPDDLEELNFELIDEIFNKVTQRLGIELSLDESQAEKIRKAIQTKDRFTVAELSKELQVDPLYINNFVNNSSNGVLDNFKVDRTNTKNKGYVYTKK